MMDMYSRTEMLIGSAGLDRLVKSKVLVFGLGGVGSFTVEALARAGVGCLELVDYDNICASNINRQLHALHSTVGRAKTEVLYERVRDINPRIQVNIHQEFIDSENVEKLLHSDISYVVDAIDTVGSKTAIIEKCVSLGLPVISAMGAGNRMDPTCLKIGDISETSTCPLARAVRRELKKRGITKGITVVYSVEPAIKILSKEGRRVNGSISFVPPVCGMYLAARVVRDLIGTSGNLQLDK